MIPAKEEIKKSFDGRFPQELYEKLQSSEAAVAGLGGLGSHIAVMLARSGIGRLHLVDFDTVDISNLNRQEYDIRHLGRLKTEALSERLREISPYIRVTAEAVKVTEENAARLFGGFDYVCEAFDMPEQKAMLINTLLASCPNTVIVSGNGMAGLDSANAIKTRRIGRRLYICGDEKSGTREGMGLMAARVSVCAGHQANQVIRLILGIE